MKIIFSNNKKFDLISAYGRKELVNSFSDLLNKINREIIELHFDSTKINMGDIQEYYLDPDNKMGYITIIDDENKAFVHTDYVIPLEFGMKYVDDDTNPHIIMSFAQLNETDKTLREFGKRKVYTGTDLEIALAKKKDEISNVCNQSIMAGIDVNEEHYTLDTEDQTNINAWLSFAMNGFPVPYHADNQRCRIYTADEFKTIGFAAIRHVVHHTTYHNMLTRWLETLTNIEQINAVSYGITELTGEYLENYTEIMNSLPINAE